MWAEIFDSIVFSAYATMEAFLRKQPVLRLASIPSRSVLIAE